MFFVDGFDGALEAAEEGFSAEEGRGEVDCVGEFVDCFRVSMCLDVQWRIERSKLTVFEDLVKVF